MHIPDARCAQNRALATHFAPFHLLGDLYGRLMVEASFGVQRKHLHALSMYVS